MEYSSEETEYGRVDQGPEVYDLHNWKPPCSCGVGLAEAIESEGDKVNLKRKIHNWKPPCSCGVSLDDISE
ncbi:hypothetical protein DRN73_02765 [Candidatus Pacearchaeota archaeon]|nr:MAG: hypothetical protein DRN73_02765 [Candidatus Pacearchaeota archaeon]